MVDKIKSSIRNNFIEDLSTMSQEVIKLSEEIKNIANNMELLDD